MIKNEITKALIEPMLAKGFHEMPFEDYLKVEAASSHGLMDIRRSPKYYKWRKNNQKKTDAMSLGSLVHSLVLEPHILENKMRVKQKVDGRTKEGKAYNEDFMASVAPGDIVIDTEMNSTLLKIRDSLFENDFSKKILNTPSIKETAGFWVHDHTGAFCKIRPDIAILEGDIMVDIKTTQNAHPMSFMKDIYNLNYDIQAAFYIDGYREITGRTPKFVWLCVENNEPHDVACYHATEKIYGFGKVRYEKTLAQYAHCYSTNSWPGYAQGIVPLDLPHWVETAEQNREDVEMYIQENL